MSGCCCRYCDYDTKGVDAFVLESYRIREGKRAIMEMKGEEMGCLDPELLEEYTDTIDDGDQLAIALFHPTRSDLCQAVLALDQEMGFPVVGGKATLPLLDPVHVEGLTLAEAKRRLQQAYEREVSGTEVFVSYKARPRAKVELIGETRVAAMPVNGRMRLFEVLGQAQAPANANWFASYVLRDGCPLPVDMARLVAEGDMCENIVMRPHDKVYIASHNKATVMVMGEVNMAGPVDCPLGTISLRDALVAAGGIPFTGNKQCIQVIRGNVPNPRIFLLKWSTIVHLPNQSLLLMPGDTVYVSAKPITEWNRFIDQLLPSIGGVQGGATTIRTVAIP
jgi:polysaccharide biosynthesis/export protein